MTWKAIAFAAAISSSAWAQTSFAPPPAADQSSGFSNFQNTPVSSILDNYEQLSGKHLIRDMNIASLPPITLNATGVGKEEFLRLIEATLASRSCRLTTTRQKSSAWETTRTPVAKA
jgi:hypothetical protein